MFAAAGADPDPWAALMAIVDKRAADATEPIMGGGLLVEVITQAHHDPEFAAGLAENDRRQISESRGSSADCGRPGSGAERGVRM